jgi:ParB family chromosome partitioning protein
VATKAPVFFKRNNDQASMTAALAAGNGSPAPVSEPIKSGFGAVGPTPSNTPYVVGRTYEIPLHRLQRSENNARVFYSSEELDGMSKSLLEKGQDVAANGYVLNDKVVLVDGQKRFQSSTSAGLPTLKVMIIETPADDREEYEASRRINIERSAQTSLDDALRWKALLEKGVYKSQVELAKRMGTDESVVSRILKINRIPERILRNMSAHPQVQPWTIAYEISNIFGDPRFVDAPDDAAILCEDVIAQIVKDDMSRPQVTALIKSKLKGPQTRDRADSSSVKYGDTKGTLKVFPSRGQIDLSFKGLPEGKVEELRIRIEQMLSGQLTM